MCYYEYFPDPIPSTSQAVDVKREPEPIFSLYNVNTGSLEDLFSNTSNSVLDANVPPGYRNDNNNAPANVNIGFDDDFSDDCEMIGDTVPLPLASTSEGLIKKVSKRMIHA